MPMKIASVSDALASSVHRGKPRADVLGEGIELGGNIVPVGVGLDWQMIHNRMHDVPLDGRADTSMPLKEQNPRRASGDLQIACMWRGGKHWLAERAFFVLARTEHKEWSVRPLGESADELEFVGTHNRARRFAAARADDAVEGLAEIGIGRVHDGHWVVWWSEGSAFADTG